MRPAVRRVTVRIKQLYDAKEQEFFGALSGTLNARQKLRAAPGRPERAGADRRAGPGPLAAPAGPQGLRPGLPDPHRRGRGAQGGRAGPAGQRGAVPVAGPELLGRDQHRRRRRGRPLPQRVGPPRARLRPGRAGRRRPARPGPSRRPRAGGTVRRRGGPAAGGDGRRDLAGAPPRRHLAALGDGRRQPARGPQRPRPGAQHPRRLGPQGARGPARPPGVPRRADRPGQPGPVHRAGRARPGPLGRGRPGRPVHRPGRLQDVNDSLGHAAGDQLLVAAARRLQGCLRPSDVAARLGGDEFAVLLERVTDAEAAATVADRVLDTLHQPFGLDGRTIPIKASIGVATGPAGRRRGRRAAAQRRRGHVRGQGRGQGPLRAVPARHARGMLERLELEAELRHVADRDQLRAALPADRRAGDGPHHRGRGAGPLGPPDQGLLPPAGVHPPGRGAGPDRADRQLGAAAGLPPGPALAATSSRTRRRCRSTSTCPAASSRSRASSTRWRRRWRPPGCRRASSSSRSPRASWSATSRR